MNGNFREMVNVFTYSYCALSDREITISRAWISNDFPCWWPNEKNNNLEGEPCVQFLDPCAVMCWSIFTCWMLEITASTINIIVDCWSRQLLRAAWFFSEFRPRFHILWFRLSVWILLLVFTCRNIPSHPSFKIDATLFQEWKQALVPEWYWRWKHSAFPKLSPSTAAGMYYK